MQQTSAHAQIPRSRILDLLGLLVLTIVGIGYMPAIFVPLLSQTHLHHPLITVHVAFVSLWLLG